MTSRSEPQREWSRNNPRTPGAVPRQPIDPRGRPSKLSANDRPHVPVQSVNGTECAVCGIRESWSGWRFRCDGIGLYGVMKKAAARKARRQRQREAQAAE